MALPPPPPPPTVFGQPRAGAQTSSLAGLLAIVGGGTFFLLTIFATIYQPLHYEYSVNYGDSLQFGDMLVFVLGVAATIVGLLILLRRGDAVARGWGLLVAGLPVLVLTAVWALSFDFSAFYFGFVFFADFGRIEAGRHFIQVPLLIAASMVTASGLLQLSAGRGASPPR